MEPIKLSEDLRVNDYDANQYTVEARTVAQGGKSAGKVTWAPIAYVGGVKSLPDVARRVYVDHFTAIARKLATATAREHAGEAFDAMEFAAVLADLPAKNGKKGSAA